MVLNAAALTRLYDRHAEEILAFLARRTDDPEAAVDILAETFAAAFVDRRAFRGEDDQAARAWLYGIARHQLVDHFRHQGAQRRALARLGVERRALTDAEYERIEELAGSRELRELVAREIDRLPEDQREAVRLRVICEETYETVATTLGISRAAARARVSRGVRSLRAAVALPDTPPHHDHERSLDHA